MDQNCLKRKRIISLFLTFAVILGVIFIPAQASIALASESENDFAPMTAEPPPNWDIPEPGNPDYWDIPNGVAIRNTSIAFVGLRYDGSTENDIKLIMPFTFSASSVNLKNFQFKVDSDLLPYVKEVRARSFLWLVEAVPSQWRTGSPVSGEEGVYQFPFYTVNGGLLPGLNAGALNQINVPIEIILKDGYTTANISQEPYVIQMRVNGERSGRLIVAEESIGKATVVFPIPTTGRTVSNWLNEPAIMGASYNHKTNVLRYFWRTNPLVTYRVASIEWLIPKNKPYMLNVIADPAIIEASEQMEIYAYTLTGREGPHYIMSKDKIDVVFDSLSNPGYRAARITPDNGSVNTVDNYIVQDYGAPDIPIYTILEFKINPEKLFHDGYHVKAPIKMFFTEKLNSSQRLINNSSAENFFMLSKTFYLPEVNDVFTEDTVITGYTESESSFVRIELPDGSVFTGDSAEEPDVNGKYPFSIELNNKDNYLEKGMEIKVQVAEVGKTLSNPVIETVNAKVTFNQNYEGEPEPEVVIANDDKNINNLGDLMPENPIREGYVFGGWYSNSYLTGEEFTKDTEIIKSITVYAKWINEPSVKPVDLKQEYINEKQVITGKFENGAKLDPVTSEIILVDESGNPILGGDGQLIKGTINPDGTFEFPIEDLKHGDKVKVQLAEKDRLPTISDETLTIDKEGPIVIVVNTEVDENFIKIDAKVDEPDANVVVEVGDEKFPVTLDPEGNFTITLPKDLDGEIVIVATDVFGNKTEKTVDKYEFIQKPIDIRGKKPYAENFTFTAYAEDGITAIVKVIRNNEIIYSEEIVVRNGRATFVLTQALEVGDVLILQGELSGRTSETITYRIDR